MSALNPIILQLKNPPTTKNTKELSLSENGISILEIPADLLQRAIQTCDTKTEIVVYLSILRFSLGFNRNTCTTSRRFLEKWTGIKNQNIGRGIEGLMQKGLIEKLPESNMKHGDVYKVIHLSEISTNCCPMTRNQNESTQTIQCNQSESTQCDEGAIKLIAVRSQNESGAQSERLRSAIDLSAKNKKEELEESSSFSESFQKHIESLPEPHLQKTERKALTLLKAKFSDAQIHMALEHAKSQGTTGGHSIKLPLCYLSSGTSMESILKAAIRTQATEDHKKQLQDLAHRKKAEEETRARAINELEQDAHLAFETYFPCEKSKEEILQKIIKEQLRFSNPKSKTARKVAILRWFKNQRKNQNIANGGEK